MQNDFPLTLQPRSPADAAAERRAREVVTLQPDGSVQRISHAELAERVDRLARVLGELGVEQGDRVATSPGTTSATWSSTSPSPCMGAVLHTLNVRLFEEQLTYIVNHAEDRVIFVDDSLVPVLEKLAPTLRDGRALRGDGRRRRRARCRTRCATRTCSSRPAPGRFDYPELDERQAAALCYTSGTTGNPKGVLYSHRSISLHSSTTLMTDGIGLSPRRPRAGRRADVPRQRLGLPYGAALAGADLILPDRFLGAEPLAKLIARERPTLMGCVPTIFSDLLRYADEHPDVDLSSLDNAACGGSAVPRS